MGIFPIVDSCNYQAIVDAIIIYSIISVTHIQQFFIIKLQKWQFFKFITYWITLFSKLIIHTCDAIITAPGIRPPQIHKYQTYAISVGLFADHDGRQLCKYMIYLNALNKYQFINSKLIIRIVLPYVVCKCYLTLTMSVPYLPIPNNGNSENDSARGHINCTCQL